MSCYWKFKIDKIASFVLISEEVQNLVCSLRNKQKQQHIYVFVKHSIASLKTWYSNNNMDNMEMF